MVNEYDYHTLGYNNIGETRRKVGK